METILKIENLTKVFKKSGQPDFTAVDDVSFELKKGEILGIVGESGSGKSTIVKLITRLHDATSGKIEFNGEDVTNVKGRAQREYYKHVQMVFQSPHDSFDPRRTLGVSVGESLHNRGLSSKEVRERVEKLFDMCEIVPEMIKRYPHQVSGGQCQRAAIARAIAIDPEVLICDEATSALDVTIQKEIVALLKSLQKQTGMSILFICHDIALVQEMCDRMVVICKGKIVESGTPDEVIKNPKEEYTKNLIACVL